MEVDKIQVHTGRMNGTISDMSSGMTSIRNSINQIYQDMNELDSMWDGTANQEFRIQFEKDQEELITICNEIDRYIDKVEYAKNEYNKCENTVADIINAIRV